MFQARAAAAPRLLREIVRKTEENAALIEELEKYRGTDPGSRPRTAVTPPADSNRPKTIAESAAEFDKMG